MSTGKLEITKPFPIAGLPLCNEKLVFETNKGSCPYMGDDSVLGNVGFEVEGLELLNQRLLLKRKVEEAVFEPMFTWVLTAEL
jgi:hypothetical protein